MTARVLAVTLLSWGIVASPVDRRAHATTFVVMSEGELATRSVAAVTGRVTRIDSAVTALDAALHTYVFILPDEILFGTLPAGEIALRELGGQLGGRREWVFGSAEYVVGERVLVFLSRSSDDTLRTTAMSLGKYRLAAREHGIPLATRHFGEQVALLDRKTGHLRRGPDSETIRLPKLRERVRVARSLSHRSAVSRPVHAIPPELAVSVHRETRPAFTLLGPASRWFEPDDGQAVAFVVDAAGDSGIGPVASQTAIDDALTAWSAVPSSRLLLENAGTTTAAPFGGCPDENRIVFNDPFNEVQDPTDCRGVLAVGGFCTSAETRTVGGTTFHRIVTGKVTFNNGWSDCAIWTPCNLAEVATHEIGHAIGLGHSADETATMAARAHFDTRCAALASDDVDAISFVYPPAETSRPTPTSSPSPTAARSPTRTPTRTRTATRTRIPTRTVTATRTSTATRTPTTTRTATATLPPTQTALSSPTPTIPAPPTPWLQPLLDILKRLRELLHLRQ